MFEVVVYEKEDGQVPFSDFLAGLAPKLRAKVLRDVELLERFGNQLREPYTKALSDGLFELRTKQGTDIARSIYFFFDGSRIVITNGFVKKTAKTPSAEIKRASAYRDDWKRRESN